jgi:hypothetical protein
VNEDEDVNTLMVGMLLDAREELAVVLMSEDAVGVSVARYDQLPARESLRQELRQKLWIVVFRDAGEEVFVSSADTSGLDDAVQYKLSSPQERESVQFAMEVAMGVWPEWCPHLRDEVKPRSPIVIPKDSTRIPVA